MHTFWVATRWNTTRPFICRSLGRHSRETRNWPTVLAIAGLIGLLSVGGAAATAREDGIEVFSVLINVSEQVAVPAREAGVLSSLKVREGMSVEMGDELGRLEDEEAKSARDQAQLELQIATQQASDQSDWKSAQETMRVAEAELARTIRSRDRLVASVSEADLEQKQLDVTQWQLKSEHLQSELAIAELTAKLRAQELKFAEQKLRRRAISAPLSGVVLRLERRVGEWVNPGETVLQMIRLDRLRAEGFMAARDASQALLGKPVRVTVDLPEEPQAQFEGTVTFVSPQIDPVNQQVRVWAEVANPNRRLQPGMRAAMTIERVTPTTRGR